MAKTKPVDEYDVLIGFDYAVASAPGTWERIEPGEKLAASAVSAADLEWLLGQGAIRKEGDEPIEETVAEEPAVEQEV